MYTFLLLVHNKIENCSIEIVQPVYVRFSKRKKDHFLVSLSLDMKAVREHSRCFTAYKCGIMLQTIVGLQVTVSTRLMHEYFKRVSSVFTHWIALLPSVLADSHRPGVAQIDNE